MARKPATRRRERASRCVADRLTVRAGLVVRLSLGSQGAPCRPVAAPVRDGPACRATLCRRASRGWRRSSRTGRERQPVRRFRLPRPLRRQHGRRCARHPRGAENVARPRVQDDRRQGFCHVEERRRQIRYEFNMSDWLVKEIPRFNGILVYGFQEDDEDLKNIGRVFYASKRYRSQIAGSTLNPKAVKILKIARNNEKFMELTEKHIYVKDLLKQKGGKIVSQFVTARYIDKVLHEIGLPIYMKDETIIGSIAELSELYTKLDEYSKTYYVQKYQYAVTENFEEEMTKLVFSNGLEDKEILADLELFLSYIDKYPVTLLLDPSRLKAEYAKGILEEYVKERGEVNPMLLKKLKEFKKSKDGKTI